VSAVGPALIAVDGANSETLRQAVRRLQSKAGLPPGARARGGRRRSGVSHWDASGLFEQLVVAEEEAGAPSARTLLLLYAADLAFRLRWEIEPALAEGRTVIAAPYVDTAIAFGRAAGIRGGWLMNLFQFAMRPAERRYVDAAWPRGKPRAQGFVEFCCAQLDGRQLGLTRKELTTRTRVHLAAAARRARSPSSSR
jgi:hypothetical protein